MSKNPRSHDLEEVLAGYVLGDLDEQELVWLNEQIAANPQLKEQVSQLESTLNLLPYGLPEDLPRSNLRNQILAQAKPKTRKITYRWSWILSAVTAISTLLLGVNNLSLRQQVALREDRLQQQQELIALLSQPDNRLMALTAYEDGISTSGNLLISPQSNQAVLTVQNLEALSGSKVYRLWAISQGKKVGCSNFKPDDRGEVYLNLSGDDALFDANSILITIEPQADTEQPLGEKFLSGSFSKI